LGTSEHGRPRRFALPSLDDERTDESIEAFLEGPEVRRHRPVAKRSTASTAPDQTSNAPATARPARPTTDLRSIPGRLEWQAALDRESLRAARDGRPASVAIVEVRAEREGPGFDLAVQRLAGPIAGVLRRDTRATDLVARVATGRFQVLLPETDQHGAGRFGDRALAACRDAITTSGAPATVRVSVAAATSEHSLGEALAHALSSIEAA
jgi:hypothetical protein